jgi:hypothetical protein
MRVKPGDVAGRQLEIQDSHRAVLKHLPMMRFMMHGDNRACSFRRLWRRILSVQRSESEHERSDCRQSQ